MIDFLINNGAKTARSYFAPDYVEKVSYRNRPRMKFYSSREKHREFVVTLGRPNSEERAFIKQCKKAGMTFPIKKIQFKFYPLKKKGKK